ncbi:hypothetical protein [Streptomyces bohaiensis]|uniref:hypothetical protein n=1 Tax=Streptomyces bohaiensis TaxID=1431344 RepID=UPI003B7B6348
MTQSPTLDGLAREFADKLTDLTKGVLGEDAPRFHAIELAEDRRVRVQPIWDDEKARPIPVRIAGIHRISLVVTYDCCWDVARTFLATDKSAVKVLYEGSQDPLFRFEYERRMKDPPGAHFHVHAHRDEVAYLLRLSESGRPGRQLKHNRLPRLAELHMPVGGHHMRPSLEDALLFLVREFAIDTADGWEGVLGRHREEWRLVQLGAAVRDAPETAAAVLRKLGYDVTTPPSVPGPREGALSAENKLFFP